MRILCFLLTCLWIHTVSAIEPRTENTYRLSDGESPPAATLEDAAWLAGSWKGTGFGQTLEEVWNPPSAGSMVGMFKVFKGDQVSFYEIMTLSVDAGRLSLKVKHFNADFTAWEEKEDYVSFKIVDVKEGELHFAGISFYQRGSDAMDVFVVMRTKDGVKEEKLSYQRVR